MTELTQLFTARHIIEKLGGEAIVAKMTHVGKKAVNNWANWNRFPANTYAKMMFELNLRGYTASPRLWRQVGTAGLQIRRVAA